MTLSEMRTIAEAATPGPWKLDKEDMWVLAEKVPPEISDWYWITGDMSVAQTKWQNAESDSESKRSGGRWK